jgi:hypothetical protein
MALNKYLESNPYPEHDETSAREQGDGNTAARGELHGQKKASSIPANRRYAGAKSLREADGNLGSAKE